MEMLVEIVTICFVAICAVTLLGAMGYKQVSGLLVFITVCIVVLKTITLFSSVIAAMKAFVFGVPAVWIVRSVLKARYRF